MATTKNWLGAMRLRTLPLAASSSLMGGALALLRGGFSWSIFGLTLLTTLLLQVLSNLANDYGDSKSGVDNANRVGPTRGVQSGAISSQAMKKAMILFGVLAFLCGFGLLVLAFGWSRLPAIGGFTLLGLGAIAAAVKYTVGENPYGYRGLGDVFVFLFFGIVGVLGSSYLHDLQVSMWEILPAATVGFFSAAVLNLNNLRDVDNDKNSGKNTLVVKIGFANGKRYHYALIMGGWLCLIGFIVFAAAPKYLLLLVCAALPIFLRNLATVAKTTEPATLDPELKKIALGTFATCLFLFLVNFWL